MRTVTYRLVDLIRARIPLGFRGENEYSRIIFDCKKAFDEYPTAIPSLAVTPPVGDPYPAVCVRDGDYVYWDVLDSDVAYDGDGEGQLTFTVDSVVKKSYKFKTKIDKSILPTGEAPSAIDDWIARANTALGNIPQTISDSIDEALAEAKASGEFDGEDGVSPVVTITPITNGYRISIKDADGTHTADVLNGQNGNPGYSPTVSITDITGGHRIAITDQTGTHTADVMDGTDGDDGYSPTVTVTSITGGHTVTITDKNGDHSFNVMDGQGGDVIDDTATTALDKTWSAKKISDNFSDVDDALSSLNGAISAKYTKPSGGIPGTDLADTYIEEPTSPATGAFLVYNGSAWVGQTLSTWQGGNY